MRALRTECAGRWLAAIAAFLCALGTFEASAQTDAPASEPAKRQIFIAQDGGFAISGWRARRGANEIQFFDCEEAACKPGSKVSFRLYRASGGPSRTLAQFRSEQEQVAKLLEERAGQGMKIEVLDVQGDDRAEPPRFFQAVRVQTRSDGSREFVTSGLVIGSDAEASVISSAPDRDTAFSNYSQFMLPIAMMVQGKLKPFPPEKK